MWRDKAVDRAGLESVHALEVKEKALILRMLNCESYSRGVDFARTVLEETLEVGQHMLG